MILEGPGGIASLGPEHQEAFVEWVTVQARAASPAKWRDAGASLRVDLDYMQVRHGRV